MALIDHSLRVQNTADQRSAPHPPGDSLHVDIPEGVEGLEIRKNFGSADTSGLFPAKMTRFSCFSARTVKALFEKLLFILLMIGA